MAQMLERRRGEIPSFYMALLDHLLKPVLLEHEGCVPSVVRLLGTFFDVNAAQIADRTVWTTPSLRLFHHKFIISIVITFIHPSIDWLTDFHNKLLLCFDIAWLIDWLIDIYFKYYFAPILIDWLIFIINLNFALILLDWLIDWFLL